MLSINRLAGFGAKAGPPTAGLRFTKQYTYTFPASTTVTITVAAVDLAAADPSKQILVFCHAFTPTITGMTIDGVQATELLNQSSFTWAYAAPYAGAGPFNIVITATPSGSEAGGIEVYEVTGAQSLIETARTLGGGTALPFRVPKGGMWAGAALSTVDTGTFTWVNATENADADVGAYRGSSASIVAPAAAATNVAATVTATAGTVNAGGVVIQPQSPNSIGGGMRNSPRLQLGSGSTVTWPLATPGGASLCDFTRLGACKMFAVFKGQADVTITGATFNGIAMTSVASIINTTATPDLIIHIFSLDVNQASPAGNIVITCSASVAGVGFSAEVFAMYRVGSIGAAQSVSGNGTGNALAVTVAEGGFILACHIRDVNTQTVLWTGADELADLDINGAFRNSAAQYPYATAEVNRTIQAVGSAAGEYATLAIALAA